MENGKSRLQRAQEDVEEVTVIMLDNMNKAEERSGKLDDLEDRADKLLAKAEQFKKTSDKLERSYWWKNTKLIVVIVVVVLIVVLIVVLLANGVIPTSSSVTPIVTPTTITP